MKRRAREQLGGNLFGNTWLMALLVGLIFHVISGAAGSTVVGVIVTGPIAVGMTSVFMSVTKGKRDISLDELFSGFSNDFADNLLLGLMQTLYIFLWSLLFIIPGIIKAYSYSMAYYIKLDHPTVYSWNDCLQESARIMKGNKWKLFVLDLSFLGWFIVGALCLGVGVFWVIPYYQTAKVNFYESLKPEQI